MPSEKDSEAESQLLSNEEVQYPSSPTIALPTRLVDERSIRFAQTETWDDLEDEESQRGRQLDIFGSTILLGDHERGRQILRTLNDENLFEICKLPSEQGFHTSCFKVLDLEGNYLFGVTKKRIDVPGEKRDDIYLSDVGKKPSKGLTHMDCRSLGFVKKTSINPLSPCYQLSDWEGNHLVKLIGRRQLNCRSVCSTRCNIHTQADADDPPADRRLAFSILAEDDEAKCEVLVASMRPVQHYFNLIGRKVLLIRFAGDPGDFALDTKIVCLAMSVCAISKLRFAAK